jgi:hypothetical protein
MVRSSYRAGEFYLKNVLQGERAQMQQQRQQQQQQQQQQPTEQEAAVVGG